MNIKAGGILRHIEVAAVH